MDKLKVYAISIMAFRQASDTLELSVISDIPSDGNICIVEQLPGLVPAESIEAAAESAKAEAFSKWQTSEAWYGHQAAIMPVTKQFFELALKALAAGAIDTITEEGERCFSF